MINNEQKEKFFDENGDLLISDYFPTENIRNEVISVDDGKYKIKIIFWKNLFKFEVDKIIEGCDKLGYKLDQINEGTYVFTV